MAAALVAMDGVDAITHMIGVCQMNANNIISITATEGITTIAMLRALQLGTVHQMTNGLSKLPVNRGGSFIGMLRTNNLKALVWWVQDHAAQCLVTDPNDWMAIAMALSLIHI